MKKAILAVSFGTTNRDQIDKAILSTVNALEKAYPEYEVRWAFSSQVVINRLRESYGMQVNSISEALEGLYDEGVEELIVQPLHLIKGKEYEKVLNCLEAYRGKMIIKIGEPLMSIEEDYKVISEAIHHFHSDKESLLLILGHGTDHQAAEAYDLLAQKVADRKLIGSVATLEKLHQIEQIAELAKIHSRNKVRILPLMLVAGNHLEKDIKGIADHCWEGKLIQAGLEVQIIEQGLGENEWVAELFIAHIQTAKEYI